MSSRVLLSRWLILSPVVMTFAAVEARADEWHTYQHDVAHTGRSSASFDPRDLEFAWKAPAGYQLPLIVGDSVIGMKSSFGTRDPDYITSFRLSDGHVNWSITADYYFPSPMTYANGLLVYTATDGVSNADLMYVRDAATGALKYTMPIDNWISSSITIGPAVGSNPSPVAYLASHRDLTAVRLGATSASKLWTKSASIGGDSSPTIAGNSVLVAGPGQYYAFDRSNGSMNHFQDGNISGGGGNTVVYDATLKNFYVLEDYETVDYYLTAYRLNSNNSITRLWQRTDLSYGPESVALGADGKIYVADSDRLLELSPTNDATLRTLPNQDFAGGVTPLVQDGYVWAYTDDSTQAFDLSTFTLARTLPGSRGTILTTINGPGAISDDYFIVDYGFTADEPGFDVYTIPPPPMPGDANLDNVVDGRDLAMLVGQFGRATGSAWNQGDFNGDGRISLADVIALRNQFGAVRSSASQHAAVAHVPEGSAMQLGVMALACLAIFRKRCRRALP